MALLNYAKTFEEVKDYLNVVESSTGDYVKLIFTLDGHIITHGADLLADYLAGKRGLVPNYKTDLGDYAIFGKNGWGNLTVNYLPIYKEGSYDNNTILTSKLVEALIGAGFSANDAMRFKGVVTPSSNIVNPETGDTYRVAEAGEYFGKTAEIGDLLICIDEKATGNTAWTIVQTNINGTRTVSINNANLSLYTNNPSDLVIAFYAPTSNGYVSNSHKILVSADNTNGAPIWATPTLSIDENQLKLNVNNTLISAVSIKALSAGNGLTMEGTYNGSAAKTIQLLTATTTTLGGVIVDDTYLTINNGKLSLDPEKIRGIVGGDINSIRYTLSATTENGKPILKLSGTTESSVTLNGTGVDIIATNNVINVALKNATSTTLGGIKLGYDSSGKNYAVLLDDDYKAYVNVPWTWRDIQINDNSINNQTLNIKPSKEIYIIEDKTEDNVYNLSFGLSWFNISTNTLEYAN